MNSNEDYLPRLDPGAGMLPRKLYPNLKMEAYVYHQATNLLPPEPAQPQEPPQPPTEIVIASCNKQPFFAVVVKKRQAIINLTPRTNAPKDLATKDSSPEDYPAETRLC